MFNYSTSITFADEPLEPLDPKTVSSKEEEKSILPQRKPRLPIETLTFRRFPGNEKLSEKARKGSPNLDAAQSSNLVSDAEIMYEVGKAAGNQVSRASPIWLQRGEKVSADNSLLQREKKCVKRRHERK